MLIMRRSLRTPILMAGCLLFTGIASAVGIPPCTSFSGQTVNDSTSISCSVQDKLFQFIGSSSDYVDIGNSLNSPAGLEFYGYDSGGPIDFTLGGIVNIEYIVSVISPFEGQANPLLIASSDIPSLVNGTANGSLGGTVSFCVGQNWDANGVPNPTGFNGSFTGDDGCSANGGTFSSTTLTAGTSMDFSPAVTSVAVWDQITVSSGAGFGSIEEAFNQTPEPGSLVMIGSGVLLILGKRIKQKHN